MQLHSNGRGSSDCSARACLKRSPVAHHGFNGVRDVGASKGLYLRLPPCQRCRVSVQGTLLSVRLKSTVKAHLLISITQAGQGVFVRLCEAHLYRELAQNQEAANEGTDRHFHSCLQFCRAWGGAPAMTGMAAPLTANSAYTSTICLAIACASSACTSYLGIIG